MPDERTYHVISDDNCKFESMTKEQILAAIVQAVEGHSISDVDTGFVQVLKEQNHGAGLKFWIGTTAEYNALHAIDQDCFYILTDDTELEDMETEIASFRSSLEAMTEIVSGLSDTVAAHTSEIEGMNDSLTEIETRNGFVFLDDENEIPYNPQLVVPVPLDYIHGETPIYIDDFTLVVVYTSIGHKIPCTIRRSATNITIQGVNHNGTQLYENEGIGCGYKRDINIFLELDLETRSIIGNRSTTSQFSKHYQNSEYSIDINFAGCAINKIVGVM